MNRSLALLIASSVAGALVAACSAAPETGGLYGSHSQGPGSATTSPPSNPANPSNPSDPGTPGPTGTTPSPVTQPPPPAGPGSTGSPAHQFFNASVYSQLSVCAACHGNGNDGAPKMMETSADITYSELDARGLIVSNSMLLTQGIHDSSKAPALTSAQQSVVQQWLSMEATERAGSAAPVNVLQAVAGCVDETLWNNIGWKNLKTVPRNGENPNRCTGCNNAECVVCHEGGEASFFMAEGSNLQKAGTTFQTTFKSTQASQFMVRYFGLNGVMPVASNAIKTKQTAVAAGKPYSHPMFTMTATMQTALDTFVNDAITKYTNKTCTGGSGPSDAGTD